MIVLDATPRAAIKGIGTAIPERVVTNADLEQLVDTTDEWITSRTGIKERRLVSGDETASSLAELACKRALADAGMAADQLDLIIACTFTGDYRLPAVSNLLEDRLGATKAGAFDLSAACAGFIYGLVTASQFIQAGSFRNVLVSSVEVLSSVTDWEDRSTCVLFGDGAGAAVLTPAEGEEGLQSFVLGSRGSGAEELVIPYGGSRTPLTPETLAERKHFVHMNGREVFKFAVTVMGESSLQVIEGAGWRPEDVDLIIPHQANKRIVDAAMKRLELPMEKAFMNLERFGNTSSASIPLALDEALARGLVKEGDKLVMSAFGGGLTYAACSLVWGTAKGSMKDYMAEQLV